MLLGQVCKRLTCEDVVLYKIARLFIYFFILIVNGSVDTSYIRDIWSINHS